MKRDVAIKIIDDMASILAVSIPEYIEIDGENYNIKDDILKGDREKMLGKYQTLYERIREKLDDMDDVPEELVNKALILRRAILFLKEYKDENEVEDKKRWMEYIKRVSQ